MLGSPTKTGNIQRRGSEKSNSGLIACGVYVVCGFFFYIYINGHIVDWHCDFILTVTFFPLKIVFNDNMY